MYWPPRLLALGSSLCGRGDEFLVVEIAGGGSPYDFAAQGCKDGRLSWSVLFPQGDLRQLSGRTMAAAVERKLNDLTPDVVMAGAIAFPSGAAAVRWARRNQRAVVIFDNVRAEDVPRSPITEYVKRRFYTHIDAMLIPAESHVRSFVQWGVPRERMHFGLNVVDNPSFTTRAAALRPHANEFRGKNGLASRFFLGVGRLVDKKNWIICLEAYRQYRRACQGPSWGLVLVGDGPERDRLQKMVVAQAIPDVYISGPIHGDALIAYYAAAGALVLPSLYGETWGLVVNEAMACGLPVLVSEQCGCAETLVHDGINGWRFSPDKPEQLAERMLQMSGLSEQDYQKMVSASQEMIRPWGLERFVEGAMAAIEACKDVRRGFTSPLGRLLISLWNGRFRPT
ncbi:MAG TPA: glycosyltransferase family 4 protein [Sedimentisphaerales bacterium]|nr:glycosyltransferase family 4 protein [Sedimentisphaerales bacterium]